MNRNVYLLLCGFFVFGCFQARAAGDPVFIGGHSQSFTICENSGTMPINTFLSITDAVSGETIIWSILTGAAHGTLYASAAASSGSGTTTPSGLSYTPATGYSGSDSFKIRVTNGTNSDTTTVHVIINPIPSPIGGSGAICLGLTTTLSDVGGTWSSSSIVATVDPSTGIVTGTATGNATITYTLPTGCQTTKVVTVNPVPASIVGTMSICSGLTTSVYDGGGGTWSSENTTVATINSGTGYYTGVSGGSVVITYTLPDGCTTITIVTVNQTPPTIGGVTNLCKGTTTNLSDGLSGGTWGSSNVAIATIDGLGNMTGLSGGTVYITYTLGSCHTVETVTIDPVAPVTGAGSLCVGGTLTVGNTVSGGLWSSAISGVAAVSATGLVTAIAPGSSVITYQTPAGCFSSATVTVNAVPLPIYGGTHICRGGATALSDGDGGGTWTSSNTALATADPISGIVTGAAAGVPIITYTVIGGCATTVAVTVSPVPAAIVGVMTICSGLTTSIYDGGGGAWTSTNTTVATINTSTGYYTGLSADTVTMIYTIAGGCTTSAVITVNATPSAITGPSTVCLGGEFSLGESLAGGVWSSSDSYIASVVSGLVTTGAAGSVTISYTLGACAATKSILINPEAPITGVTTVCNGATTMLYNVIGGGMWSSASPSIASINTAGFVTSFSPGIAVVTYALPTGCFTTASITVNLVPLPIVGVTHICTGAATNLSDPDGGGSWSTASSALATVNAATGLVTGVASGVPVITYMLSTGCKVTTPVTVNPLPTPIGGTLSACQGYAGEATDGIGGAWTSGNTLIATINPSTGYVTGILPGTAALTYTLPTGCATSAVFTVNPNPAPITGPSNVCQGDSIVLADAVGLGTWSTISPLVTVTSSTATVAGRTPGLATIVYNLGGCTTSTVILVNPITPVIGIASVCNGASQTWADLTPGGTWSSSNTSVASPTPVTGVVTGFAPGTVLITYTLPSGCNASAPFTVNPMPAAIAGVSNICLDSSLNLSDSLPGGIWTESRPYIATINATTGLLTSYSTGTLVVTYTSNEGCMVTAGLAIGPRPDMITAPEGLCQGLTVSLVDGGGGTWTTSNTAIATINNSTGFVTGVSAGDVIITYTIGGCIAVRSMTINPDPAPISGGDSTMCIGVFTPLSDAGGGSWATNNETVVYITSLGVMQGHTAGTATITYTLPVTGCWATKEVTVIVCTESVKQVNNSGGDIKISPNPNNGTFSISGSIGSLDDAEVSIAVMNMLGQVVYTNKVIARSGDMDQQILLGNNLPSGMYVLNLLWGDERKAFHIVIQQ